MTPRSKRLLLATAALSTAAAGACGKKDRPPLGNPKGSHYDLQMDAAPGDGATETPDAAPAATEP